MNPRVCSVRYAGAFRLELGFTDGSGGVVDLRDKVYGRGGVFTPLEDPAVFAQARLDPEAGTVVWPNGVDFCPDVLFSLATGAALPGASKVHR